MTGRVLVELMTTIYARKSLLKNCSPQYTFLKKIHYWYICRIRIPFTNWQSVVWMMKECYLLTLSPDIGLVIFWRDVLKKEKHSQTYSRGPHWSPRFVTWASCLNIIIFKVPLWRKSHLSYQSDIKALTSSLHEKKNAAYYLQISLFVPEIFKFLKYAN